jgi:hypothetical protein
MRRKILTTEIKRENRHPPGGINNIMSGMVFLDPKNALI